MDNTPDAALLDALDDTIEAARRLTTLAERLLDRANHGEPLTEQERQDATKELATAKAGLEELHAKSLLIRQKLRAM